MAFKLWSQLNQKATKELQPDLGFRHWSDFSDDEKNRIWKHLECYLFGKDIKTKGRLHDPYDPPSNYFEFYGEQDFIKQKKRERIFNTISFFNTSYRHQNYAKNFLEHTSLNAACQDFYNIYISQSENVVLQLFSVFCRAILIEREKEKLRKEENEKEDEYQEKLSNWRWEDFDEFSEYFNEVLLDFGFCYQLTRLGFIPRQEEKIMEEIYKPVIECLSNFKWKEVNRDLSDAFGDYRNKDYSGTVTKTISAIQGFLQILVNGETGSGKIPALIAEAQNKRFIPNDDFTKEIFNKIESFFAKERQQTGDAHPKQKLAEEHNARLVLNLAMVFLSHCILGNNEVK